MSASTSPAALAPDYALARAVAGILVATTDGAATPAPLFAGVFLGGLGTDWERAPAYPYAIIAPQSADRSRGGVARGVRVRIVAAAADYGKPAPASTGLFTDWNFADGLLAAAQAAFALRPDLATDSHLEIAGAQHSTSTIPEIYLVANGHTAAEESHSVSFAEVDISADGLTALMVDGMPWALAVVPAGGTVATRTERTVLAVGAWPALCALVDAACDAIQTAQQTGAPVESVQVAYDTDEGAPVQAAELTIAFADAQAFGDAF